VKVSCWVLMGERGGDSSALPDVGLIQPIMSIYFNEGDLMNKKELKPIIVTSILIIYLLIFGYMFAAIQESVDTNLFFGIGNIELNFYSLTFINTIFYIGFGIISSYYFVSMIENKNKIIFWSILIIFGYISILPLIYFSPLTAIRLLAWPYPKLFISKLTFDVNFLMLFRVLFGVTVGSKLLNKVSKK